MTDMTPNAAPGNPPVFTTDLFIPAYQEGRWNDWEIRKAALCLDHGYHSGVWMADNLAVLLRHSPAQGTLPETWMSPSPHEIESQELGCRHAFGHTLVMGLGLGWVAVNAALNPKVTAVTVIEIDPDVIGLVQALGILAQLPQEAREKITIIQGDALTWRPESQVDFLYADIWQKLGEACVLPQIRQMQENVNAALIYFWGQELALYNEMNAGGSAAPILTHKTVSSCVRKNIRLPLLIPQKYEQMIQKVVDNRHKRGLPLRRD